MSVGPNISDDFFKQRLDVEATRLIENNRHVVGTIDEHEKIVSHPRNALAIPTFLSSMATANQLSELISLFDRVWELNESHVGELTRKAEASICLTGECRELELEFVTWFTGFFEGRLQKHNPKDEDDNFNRFHRLYLHEFQEISHWLVKTGSVYYVLSERIRYAVLWQLIEGTFLIDIPDVLLRGKPIRQRRIFDDCLEIFAREGYVNDSLKTAVEQLRAASIKEDVQAISLRSRDDILNEIHSIAGDIQEMRPYLIRNFNPAKTIIRIGNACHVAFSWSVRCGFANITIECSEFEIISAVERCAGSCIVQLDYDGRLLSAIRPTVRVGDNDCPGMAENLILLRLIFKKLWLFYDQIDFIKIRHRNRNASKAGGFEGNEDESEDADEEFALACRDEAEKHDDGVGRPAPDRVPSIPKIRLERLRIALTKHFGCTITQSKGSEIKVFRPGYPHVTIGCHVRNREVSSNEVWSIVKRLGITKRDWLNMVYEK